MPAAEISTDLPSITLSSKGQVVLPQAIRKKLHLQPGTKLKVAEVDGKIVLEPESRRPRQEKPASWGPPTRLEDVYGSANYQGPPISIEEMDMAILEEVRRRHARGRY